MAKNDFYVIYRPKAELGLDFTSTVVTYERLKELIGLKNANKTFLAALTTKGDITTVKFRKYGKCEIRLK